MSYRVDQVPALWRPAWLVWSWVLGVSWWSVVRLLHATCRVRVQGMPAGEAFIYCLWHRDWPVWFIAFARSHHRQAFLQHPAAYMKPVHIGLELMGIRILLASSGEEARRASAALVELLEEGWSTVISPDGPAGPPQVLKKGVLHIALDSGVPVIPVRLTAKPAVRLPTWDRKLLPLPFARIAVTFGEPIHVTAETFEAAQQRLSEALGQRVEHSALHHEV